MRPLTLLKKVSLYAFLPASLLLAAALGASWFLLGLGEQVADNRNIGLDPCFCMIF